MEKLIIDTTPNMYDVHNPKVNIEDMENLAIISVEDLGEDQTIGDDNVSEPCAPDEAFLFDDGYETPDEDSIEESAELSVFGNDADDEYTDLEGDDPYDDTGFNEDDYEDMSDDSESDE